MNKLAVVFAFDDNYAMPFAVTIESLLSNKSKETFYDVFCLIPNDFSAENMSRIEKLNDKYNDFSMTFINLGDRFKNEKMKMKHISYVTYFRLLIPELLADYDKCLYLDVDMAVCQDLTWLFAYDLTGYYVGVVRHPLLNTRRKVGKYDTAKDTYFNAGMLLMNLDLMRKDNKQEEFIGLMSEGFVMQDEDILNLACFNKAKFLPLKYNLMTSICGPFEKIRAKRLRGQEYYSATQDPAIVHYIMAQKPWKCKSLPYFNVWDKYFKQSVFSDMQLDQYQESKFSMCKASFIYELKVFLLSFKVIDALNEFRKSGKNK